MGTVSSFLWRPREIPPQDYLVLIGLKGSKYPLFVEKNQEMEV
jgi:hypothetical protein